jgi:hypothetical protein
VTEVSLGALGPPTHLHTAVVPKGDLAERASGN